MATTPNHLQGMQIGDASIGCADGNIRSGPACEPQLARRRALGDSPMSSLLCMEKRPGGSGQCRLRSSKQGLFTTSAHVARQT
eukprot:8586308-Pyramimonas_sp.AAC.1